ncbi:MAG TPA: DUF2490 domain-containing protein [Flavobacteriales bacterium]
MFLRSVSLALALFGAACAFAQETARPLQASELWSSVGVQGSLPGFFKSRVPSTTAKRIRLAAEVGYRSADVFFAGRQIYTDLGGRFKISDHLSVGLEHRIAFRGQGSTRHRSGLQVMYDTEWKRMKLDYRLNYQHNYRDFGGQREMFRNRFGLEYNIPKFKFDPAVSAEFFTWAGYMGWRYTGVRYKMGTTWSITKAHSIDLSVVHDREVGIAWPTHRWICSVSYTMDLRKL